MSNWISKQLIQVPSQISWLTNGQVLFWNSSGGISQSSKLQWNDTTWNLWVWRAPTAERIALDSNISDIMGWRGWSDGSYSTILTNLKTSIIKNHKEVIKKIEEIPQVSLDNIENILNENNSHNNLAKIEILDRIEESETEICSDIIRKTEELKKDNITTRNLLRQKTKKLDENVSKLSDRQDIIDKAIEDEGEEIERQLEEIYKAEWDAIERELEDQYKKEAQDIENELNS